MSKLKLIGNHKLQIEKLLKSIGSHNHLCTDDRLLISVVKKVRTLVMSHICLDVISKC